MRLQLLRASKFQDGAHALKVPESKDPEPATQAMRDSRGLSMIATCQGDLEFVELGGRIPEEDRKEVGGRRGTTGHARRERRDRILLRRRRCDWRGQGPQWQKQCARDCRDEVFP